MNLEELEAEEDKSWRARIRDNLRTMATTVGGVPELARRAGMKYSTLTSLLSDSVDRRIGLIQAAKLAQAGKVTVHWLTYDNVDSTESYVPESTYKVAEPRPTYGMGELVYVKMFSVMAGARTRGYFNDGEEVVDTRAFRADWVKTRLRAKADDLAMIVAFGDSILIDLRVKEPVGDDIYVFRQGQSLRLKRLQRLGNGGWRVISDNPAYPQDEITAEQLTTDDVECIGKVVWWAHTNT
jgi:phage repressor protein C with HTH and peptisase S24 domain